MSDLLILLSQKEKAEEALRPFQAALKDGGLLEMTDAEFEQWKADIHPLWIATIDAQRAYWLAHDQAQA